MGRRIETAPLPRIAATYARVSTVLQDSGDKSSLGTQEAGCQNWAVAQGWLTDERFTYRDRHTGEELWERPELTRLREAARARSFGVLVCHSIDRLSRNPIHLGILLDELARLGIAVEFVTEALDDSPEAALIRFIKGYAGQIENERRRERQMRATKARVERGLPIATGRRPFGYLWTDATKTALLVNPLTAPVVVRIFRDYAAGMTLRELAAALTADGIPTATGKRATWDPGVVRALLRTSLYWGAPTTGKTRSERVPLDRRAQYRGKSVARVLPIAERTALPPTTAPALVSRAVAAEVLRRLRRNQQLATRSAKDPESALLRGLVKCGLCGSSVHANRLPAQVRADGSVPVRYVCRQALKVRKDATAGRYCTPHSVLADVLDPAVWDKVAAYLRNPQLLAEERVRMRAAEPPGTADLAALDARVVAIGKRISSLMETAEYVSDSDARRDLAAQIDLYTKQKRRTEAERAQVAALSADWDREALNLEALTTLVQDATVNLESWGYAEKRAALVALKTVVTLYAPGHAPRAEGTIRLPLRGLVTLAPPMGELAAMSVSSDTQYVR
ncbi:MAG TPA: recombinase family protein [Ktedonobacterales bacterium]|nr:recombinase family protein [Ktedonobacterales bacterium]